MGDVADWLTGLGLGQHSGLLAENDIDLEVLRELTEADLKDLGLSLGHRKKLLKAIRALGDQPEPGALDDRHAPGAHQAAYPTEAERRQLTVKALLDALS